MEGNQGDAITKAPEAIGGFLACKVSSMSGVRVLCFDEDRKWTLLASS
jgi:hypothetical protein